ncbi:hypothetical protein GCM10022243_55710 [Saccharothrix violaceirubra]|uniref:DUF4267 domain-containing protein n=1 Tax=Saccharothrix violaceirubra TaxID=413306 RepID=A0A7W7WXG6_9PSEU|nr:hypothetical protein [Saccharothrix violaceirubra]MBB4967081.1 hypothetical protein [Saccharothrix violaceirubra]
MTWPAKLIGLATAAYGAAVVVRPEVLTKPTGLATRPTPAISALVRSVGTRDVVSGLSVALAPEGTPTRAALAVRIAMDLGDAAVLGAAAPTAAVRRKVLAVTLGWAALNLVVLWKSPSRTS